jgi:hypothetical protein
MSEEKIPIEEYRSILNELGQEIAKASRRGEVSADTTVEASGIVIPARISLAILEQLVSIGKTLEKGGEK